MHYLSIFYAELGGRAHSRMESPKTLILIKDTESELEYYVDPELLHDHNHSTR